MPPATQHGRRCEAPSKVYAVRLSPEEDESLRTIARVKGRRCSDLVREALRKAGLFSLADG